MHIPRPTALFTATWYMYILYIYMYIQTLILTLYVVCSVCKYIYTYTHTGCVCVYCICLVQCLYDYKAFAASKMMLHLYWHSLLAIYYVLFSWYCLWPDIYLFFFVFVVVIIVVVASVATGWFKLKSFCVHVCFKNCVPLEFYTKCTD